MLAAPSQFERQIHHAADFVIVIFQGIDGALAAILDIAALRPAEIQAAGQFADDQNIYPLEPFRLQRR